MEKFGKQVGGDIVAGKKTFLLLKAMELADEGDKKFMSSIVADEGADSLMQVTVVREIFDKLHVKSVALEEVRKYHDTGMGHLDALKADPARKVLLKQMAETLLNREI